MPRPTLGARVAAVVSATDSQINFLGYGVYAGEEVPPADAGGFGSVLHEAGFPNPKITLDNGDEVFGCECWWFPIDAFKATINQRELIQVSIQELRAAQAQLSEEATQ